MVLEELDKGGGAHAAHGGVLEVQVVAGAPSEGEGADGSESPGSQANGEHKRVGPRRSIMGLALAPFKRASNRFRMSAARCGRRPHAPCRMPPVACTTPCIPPTGTPCLLAHPPQRQHVPAQRGRAGGADLPGEHDRAGHGGKEGGRQGCAGVRRQQQQLQRRPPSRRAAALAAGAAGGQQGGWGGVLKSQSVSTAVAAAAGGRAA